jgi:hypothetical protein
MSEKISCLLLNCDRRDHKGCACQWCIEEIKMMKDGLIGFKGEVRYG